MKVNNNIVIAVGQAGIQIASSFWRSLCAEHGIDAQDGRSIGEKPGGNWNAFFSGLGESGGQHYVPRAIMVDTEPTVLEELKSKTGSLFNPANVLSQKEGAGSNFAVGYAGEGKNLIDPVMERFGHEVTKCDNVGGVIVLHSLGGGTGSGLGVLIIESLKEKYPEIPVMSAAVLPSPQVSSVVTEPYNTVFALSALRRYADACVIFDNEALFRLAQDHWNIPSPTVEDLNQLITEALTGITASMRFTGFLTVEISLRELITNLVPQPSLHFLTISAAPLTPPDQSKFEEMTVSTMIENLFRDNYVFAACSPMEGKFLSTAVLYRGVMDDKPEADAALAAMKSKLPLTTWIPTAFKIGYVDQPGASHRRSMVMLANNTEISRVIERICQNFDKLWARKAFANWYLSEGMTDELIEELRASAGELIEVYKQAEERGATPEQLETVARLTPEPEADDSEEDAEAKEDKPIGGLRSLIEQRKVNS